MLLGIIVKLKGNPPAGDAGLQCSVKEGTRSENKVSKYKILFLFTRISPGLLSTSSLLLSSFLTMLTGR